MWYNEESPIHNTRQLVLTHKDGDVKLERADLHRKGRDHDEDPANVYERV